jgi:hypothetical protein
MLMHDAIMEGFLQRQLQEGMGLSSSSDILELFPLDPQHYMVAFHCKGLVRDGTSVEEADDFRMGIYFGPDHLRRLDPGQLITWFSPLNIWHPNVKPPFVCVGDMTPGVGLAQLLYQLHEIITWRRLTIHHPLNPDASQWARHNQHRYPVDTRPLRRRTLQLKIKAQSGEARS